MKNNKIKNSDEVNNFSDKIIKTIEDSGIRPKSRFSFLLKDWAVAGAGTLCLFIGGLATAVIIYMFDNNNWDLYQKASGNFLRFFFSTLPYLWLVVLVLFVALAYYNFKHTKSGYRYQLSTVILVAIIASLVLGVIFYSLGLGNMVDRVFDDRFLFYRQLTSHRQKVFNRVDKGLLHGVVTFVPDDNNFILKDINGRDWRVTGSEVILPFELTPGQKIIIVGKRIGPSEFKAKMIRPAPKKPKLFQRPRSVKGGFERKFR